MRTGCYLWMGDAMGFAIWRQMVAACGWRWVGARTLRSRPTRYREWAKADTPADGGPAGGSTKESPMGAYLGLHHGLLQAGILAGVSIVVILVGLVSGKLWVDRSSSVHIVRDEPGSKKSND